ncbi:hypothetical protein L1049_017215 [Liquidambar formosana]|uniref:CCT domain-containing protein n=1 Tax=Liquidambar formosana TaxID=63359 RepID=A0AAP0S7I6_LIQFO
MLGSEGVSGFVDSPKGKMLHDVIHHSPEQLPIGENCSNVLPDETSSPITSQIFEFCDSELFPETLQTSEAASCSNCCYEENSSYTTNLSFPQDINFNITNNDTHGNSNPTTTTTTTTTPNNNSNLSIIFDSQEEIDNDISASIDFSPSPPFSIPQFVTTQQGQFDFSSLQTQIPLNDVTVDGLSQYPPDPIVPLMGLGPLPPVFEEDCLSSVPSYLRLNPASPSCSFLDPTLGSYFPAGNLNAAALSADGSGIFGGSILMGAEVLQPQELEFQGENGGIYCPDSMQRVFNPGDLQALSNESQQLYACRKTLADSRPRVRGRFAKNDDFGETHRTTCSNHEDDDDEDAPVKEEEDLVDSSDIFAHISGVNSFKCNYPIQSWI